MTLRRRVVLGIVVVAVVLLTADLVLARTFQGFLLAEVDERLTSATGRLVGFAADPRRPALRGLDGRGGMRGFDGDEPFSEYFVAVADGEGRLAGLLLAPPRTGQQPPVVTRHRLLAEAGEVPLRPFTARADSGEGWRLVALRQPSRDEILVVGTSLQGVERTYGRIVTVLVIATLAVLAALALFAWWVLRHGVRPLVAMTATASSIADGALHERVPDVDDRTEAGRLGAALNTMLTRIETAFAARTATEHRLRRFVADASHELRTPLTSIRGYAELYRAGALDRREDLDDAMRRVEQEAERMGSLVEDLLLLARLDQRRPMESVPVDLAEVVADTVADHRAIDPDRPVSADISAVSVPGDEARLRQAVGNLIANVREHTPPGTPFEVSLAREHDRAVLTVSDRGPGMSAEVTERVFERFYRAEDSRARTDGTTRARNGNRQGSGLGLAIVAGVVEGHGGSVSVASAPGRGARFTISLPTAASEG